jgi:hypothetical protein
MGDIYKIWVQDLPNQAWHLLMQTDDFEQANDISNDAKGEYFAVKTECEYV